MKPQKTHRSKLAFLLPSSPGERLQEDDVLSSLEEINIEPEIWFYRKCSFEETSALAKEMVASKPDLIVYPTFDLQIFLWERASDDWFFGWSNGEPILTSQHNDGIVGIVELLRQLDDNGVPTFPINMHYDGPFDDEITLFRPFSISLPLARLKVTASGKTFHDSLTAWNTKS